MSHLMCHMSCVTCHISHVSLGQIFGYTNIFEFIRIYVDKYIHLSENLLIFSKQIYSYIHSWSIYTNKYIRTFIRPISIKANIFELSVFPIFLMGIIGTKGFNMGQKLYII